MRGFPNKEIRCGCPLGFAVYAYDRLLSRGAAPLSDLQLAPCAVQPLIWPVMANLAAWSRAPPIVIADVALANVAMAEVAFADVPLARVVAVALAEVALAEVALADWRAALLHHFYVLQGFLNDGHHLRIMHGA